MTAFEIIERYGPASFPIIAAMENAAMHQRMGLSDGAQWREHAKRLIHEADNPRLPLRRGRGPSQLALDHIAKAKADARSALETQIMDLLGGGITTAKELGDAVNRTPDHVGVVLNRLHAMGLVDRRTSPRNGCSTSKLIWSVRLGG